MKKLFTLIAAALMTIGASADEVTLWEGEATCDKWSGVGMLSDAGLELIDAAAQPGDMIKIYADVTAAAADWQLLVQEGHYDKIEGTQDVVTYAAFKQSEGDFADGTATFELTEAIYKRAITKSWWGNTFIFNGNGGVVVKKLSLVRPVHYAETAKTITFNESGFIAASEFDGLNDRAKIVFTYNRAEEPVAAHKGWGVGRVASNDATDTSDPTVKLADLGNNQAGDMSVTILMIDIKRALEATPAGIAFSVWDQDGSPTTRVKVEAFDAIADSEGGEEATGGEATDTKFNVTKYATLGDVDLKNCTTLYKYDETAKAVILTAYGAYQSSVKSWNDETKKGLGWVTYNSAGSSNVTDGWAASGVFQGSAYYGLLSSGSASHRAAAINSSRAYTFTVTGCKAVSILGKSGKKTEREVILTVKESGSDANFAEKKDATNEIVTLTVDGMDASKTYEVTVTGNTSDNGHFYEIAFYLGSTSGIQQTIAPAKVIENNVIYNLAGQRVNESYKGIVIKNGKKYIQK